MSTLREPVQQAIELLNARSYRQAAELLRGRLDVAPNDPDALQLLGLAFKHLGRLDGAEEAMRLSLKYAPQQPHVYNNLGGVLEARGDEAGAQKCYVAALNLNRTYKEAWRNLAMSYRRAGKFEEAESAARHAVSADMSYVDGLLTLGQIRQELGHEDGIAFLKKAVELQPANYRSLHALGVAQRVAGQLEEALETLRRAIRFQHVSAETYGVMGGLLQDMGRLDEAVEAFRIAIQKDPAYEEAHFALNQILFITGKDEALLESYTKAADRLADTANISCAHAQTLLFLDRPEDARDVMDAAMEAHPGHPRVTHMFAKALTKAGGSPQAADLMRGLVAVYPQRVDYRVGLARALITMGAFEEALSQLDQIPSRMAAQSEFDQELVALRYVCASQLGLAEAARIYDYDTFTHRAAIEPPAGFASLDAFNAALAARLTELHTGTQHPIEQTLRGGTQTHGRLFNLEDPLIQALKSAIQQQVEGFIAGLPDDPGHPFLGRKPDRCEFQGSWSVRLKDGGFHKNHIHGRGWLSSAYYVSLPDVVRQASNDRAGWLKLGQPNELPGAEAPPGAWVEPRTGHLALFPSYMWHGTEPFESDQPRITVAFDIAPRQD